MAERKLGPNRGNAGKGRPKGSKNKITAALKDAILQAAESAHPEGTVGYLREQSKENPTAFMSLLGKTLPLQHGGDPDNPIVHTIRRVIVDPDG